MNSQLFTGIVTKAPHCWKYFSFVTEAIVVVVVVVVVVVEKRELSILFSGKRKGHISTSYGFVIVLFYFPSTRKKWS